MQRCSQDWSVGSQKYIPCRPNFHPLEAVSDKEVADIEWNGMALKWKLLKQQWKKLSSLNKQDE